MKKLLFFLVFVILCASNLNAQDFSNKGKEFWLVFPPHQPSLTNGIPNFANLSLYLTSDKNSSGRIICNGTTIPFQVTANLTSEVLLPRNNTYISGVEAATPTTSDHQSRVLINRAIKVIVDPGQPSVVVYAHMFAGARSAASLILPSSVLGKTYYALSWNQTVTGGNPNIGENSKSQFTVIATENNTKVRINLKRGGVAAVNPILIDLPNAGDVYQYQDDLDISGTLIESVASGATSCKRIAVFSGSSSLGISNSLYDPYCNINNPSIDPLYQQCYPTNSWGKKYGVVPFKGKRQYNYRIIAADDNTEVIIKGNSSRSVFLNKGEIYTDFSNNSNPLAQPIVLEADKPVAVAQFSLTQNCDVPSSIGDPDMIFLNPIEQSINDISLFLSAKNAIREQHINVFLKNDPIALNSFKVNGVSIPLNSFVSFGDGEYVYYQQSYNVNNGNSISVRLTCDIGFNAIAYGFGNAESFGYSAGTNIVDLNPPILIENEFPSLNNQNVTSTCTNTNFKLKLSLGYEAEKIVVDFLGATDLTGPPVYEYSSPVAIGQKTVNNKTYYIYEVPQPYVFNKVGQFPVKFLVESQQIQSNGCTNNNIQEIDDNIIVDDPPVVDFTTTSAEIGCVNASVNFTDISTNNTLQIVKWFWDFQDGSPIVTDQNTSKLFTSAGNKPVKFTVVNEYGCPSSKVKNVNLSNKPIAKFIVPSIVCEKSQITFKDASEIIPGSSNNTITQWSWNFDNGAGTITETAPTDQIITYPNWGQKNISLTVTSNTGCVSDPFTNGGNGVLINPLPVVSFELPEVCLDDKASFKNLSSIPDNTESSLSYRWNFDNGNTTLPNNLRPVPLESIAKVGETQYLTAGNYAVSLKVTSAKGCFSEKTESFKVNGRNPKPDFEIIADGTPNCANTFIKIKNKSYVDNFNDVTKLEIYWDNNLINATNTQTDEDPILDKVYDFKYGFTTTPTTTLPYKDVNIQLVAYSGQSSACSKSIEKPLRINYAPEVSLISLPEICYEATPQPFNQGTYIFPAPVASAIYSGSGINSSQQFDPKLAGVGQTNITYTVTSQAGCFNSKSQPIVVLPSPEAKWQVTSTSVCEQNDITFSNNSIANAGNIVSWNWDFGDGVKEVKTIGNPFAYKYSSFNTYQVSLEVVTDKGCKNKLENPLKVNPLPIPKFTLPQICLPDGNGTFNSSLSSIADGSETGFSYLWNFGDPSDPSQSTLPNPTRRFSSRGPYNINLKITSIDGCENNLTQILDEKLILPEPIAEFSVSQLEVCQGEQIQFTGLGDGITSNPVRWLWNLGGTDRAFIQNPLKPFKDSGKFEIQYYFYNSQNCRSNIASKEVIVHPFPKLELGPTKYVLENGSLPLKPDFVYGSNLQYNWIPATFLDLPSAPIPLVSPKTDITYKLILTGIGGCTTEDEVFVKLLLAPIIPNAFSPNGDGIHDRWRIQYLESYPGATVDVYDRYGGLVFSSIEYAVDWDGTRNGKPLPIGTYYYVINPKNGRKIITGSVTILR